MHNKIKGIRIFLGLSETQISSLINISSYKYKRFENNSMSATSEVLVLLSLMYDIPIDYLILDRFPLETVLRLDAIADLGTRDMNTIFITLEANLCHYCSFSCPAVSYRAVRNILNQAKGTFGRNLYKMRVNNAIEVKRISSYLEIHENSYLTFEQGKALPSPPRLASIAEYFDTTVQYFLTPQDQDSAAQPASDALSKNKNRSC